MGRECRLPIDIGKPSFGLEDLILKEKTVKNFIFVTMALILSVVVAQAAATNEGALLLGVGFFAMSMVVKKLLARKAGSKSLYYQDTPQQAALRNRQQRWEESHPDSKVHPKGRN
jgi:hypothetical protein